MFTTSVSFIGNIYRIQTLLGSVSYAEVTRQMEDKLEKCAEEFRKRVVSGVFTRSSRLDPNSPWTVAAWEGRLVGRRKITMPSGSVKVPMAMSQQVMNAVTVKKVSSGRIASNEAAYFIGFPRTSKLHRTDKRTKYGKLMARLGQKPISIVGVTDRNTREGGYVVHPFGNKSLTRRVPSRDFFTPALNKYKNRFKAEMYDGCVDAVRNVYVLNSTVGVISLADLAARV
jgi:hypothetical protein